jgi:hypothetical protein
MCVVTDKYNNIKNDSRTVTVIGESDLYSNIFTERLTAQSSTHISQWMKCQIYKSSNDNDLLLHTDCNPGPGSLLPLYTYIYIYIPRFHYSYIHFIVH